MDIIAGTKFNMLGVPCPDDVYIIGAYRTAVGSMNGQFKSYGAHKLGAGLIRGALSKLGITDDLIDKVYMGQVLKSENVENPAELLHKEADFPASVPSYILKHDCASSLKALIRGYKDIKCNVAQFVICGGQESSSQFPCNFKLYENSNEAYKKEIAIFDTPVKKGLVVGGLTEYPAEINHLKEGEQFSYVHKIDRVSQDEQSMESIERSLKALNDKVFEEQIIAFNNVTKDETIVSRVNESYRTISSCLPLLKVHPNYLTPTITSSNSAQYADGAAVLFVCSGRSSLAFLKQPIARIVGFVEVSVSLHDLGNGQITAIRKLFRALHWNTNTVDLYEIYEPYAAQTVAIMQALQINPFRVNVTGGTIAFGNPIGATGARMVVTLIHNLRRLGLTKGIVSMYTPAGLAIAMAIEAY
ncbi:hypothetical protein ILUMI_20476 [Ignelater luminosus]|uniref:Acetyl-CoA acetyltransferase n=1 Tax=Ignelater luminosus TaxID=2038154 RepID=A0A8K0G4U4_IGNLU|nr:hypothetical protein ILUMI_20476 [Ignelater luminosus]